MDEHSVERRKSDLRSIDRLSAGLFIHHVKRLGEASVMEPGGLPPAAATRITGPRAGRKKREAEVETGGAGVGQDPAARAARMALYFR